MPTWIAIVAVSLVAAVLFALGWGIGYRIGYRDGDGVWRRASGKGYAVIDKDGRLVQANIAGDVSLDTAVKKFQKGQPAKIDRGKR